MTPTGDADNRQTPRNPVSWRARVLLNAEQILECRTFDLSAGGLGLLCTQALPIGDSVRVALQLPPAAGERTSRIVSAHAKAVYQVLSGDEYRVGMQWIALDPATLALLSPWVKR